MYIYIHAYIRWSLRRPRVVGSILFAPAKPTRRRTSAWRFSGRNSSSNPRYKSHHRLHARTHTHTHAHTHTHIHTHTHKHTRTRAHTHTSTLCENQGTSGAGAGARTRRVADADAPQERLLTESRRLRSNHRGRSGFLTQCGAAEETRRALALADLSPPELNRQ